MLKIIRGNIFKQDVQAIVNPVNTVGVMGKGLALAFKQKYPDMFRFYVDECRKRRIKTGTVGRWSSDYGDQIIYLFPTKEHWRHPSKLEYIRNGLDSLSACVNSIELKTIALPWLGCGEGKLKQSDVLPLIEAFAATVPDTEVRLVRL